MNITIASDVRTGNPRRGLARRAAGAGRRFGTRHGPTTGRGNAIHGSMALVALVAAVLAGAATQQTAAATAGHPLVGAWVVDTEVDNPTNPPSFDTFAADGTLVNIGSDGTSVGAWQATGPRTATFTFAGLTEGGRGGAIFIIRVDIEVAATGESFTATHSFTLAALDGKVLTSAKGGTARGTRIHAEPMDAAGSPPA